MADNGLDLLKKAGKNLLNTVNTVLPNNPINKLKNTYETLKRDTTPAVQKITGAVNNLNGNGTDQSRFIGFNNPSQILKTGGQLATQTPKIDTNVYVDYTNKISQLPKSSSGKEKWSGKIQQAITLNNDQELLLNGLQKSIYESKGGLTYEDVNQWIQESNIKARYPNFNADDVISLQYEIAPILMQTGEYIDNSQIAQNYPNLYHKYDIDEIQARYKEYDGKLQKILDGVNKANTNVMSENGLKYVNFWKESEQLVNQIRQDYNVGPNVTDSEILTTIWKSNEYWNNRNKQMQKASDKLSPTDLKQLGTGQRSSLANYLTTLASIFTPGNPITDTGLNQILNEANTYWQNNIQPKIDAGGVRDESGNLLPGQQAVSDILSIPGRALKGASRVSDNLTMLGNIDPNKSIGKNISEKAENLVKISGGTIETAFNTVLAPVTAMFHGLSDIPVVGDVIDTAFAIVPELVDGVFSGRYVLALKDAGIDPATTAFLTLGGLGGTAFVLSYQDVVDWYNEELDDQGREDLQNSIFVFLGNKIGKSDALRNAKLKSKAFFKTLGEAIGDALNSGKFAYDLEIMRRRKANGGNVYETRHTLGNGEEPNFGEPVTVEGGFREGETTFKDRYEATKEGIKAGTGKLRFNLEPNSEYNARLEQRLNKITAENNKSKVTQGVKEEVSDLEKEVRSGVDKQLDQLEKRVENIRREETREIRESSDRSSIVEIAREKLTGLDEGTLGRIKNNPVAREMSGRLISDLEENPDLDINEYQTRYLEDTAGTVSEKIDNHLNKLHNEIGNLYNAIENTNKPIDNSGLYRDVVDAIKDKVRFDENGDAIFSNRISGSERSTILQLLKDIRDIDDIKKLIETKRYADDNISYGSALSEGEKVIWQIRDKINDLARQESPEYKKVDDMYSEEIKVLNEFKDGITTRKDGKIVLRDNIVSVLKNLLSPANRGKLRRIEKHIPRIRDFVEAVSLLKPTYNALRTGYQSRFVGGIAKGTGGMLLRMAGLTMGGLSGYLAGTLADIGISEAMQGLAKKALKEVLSKESPKARARSEEIIRKLIEGKELSEKERQYIENLREEIYEEAEKAKKTKAEKEAWENFKKGVKDDANQPKLEKKDNVKNDDRRIVTGNDRTIVSDGKGNNKRQGRVSEADKRTEENKKTGYMTEDQLKAYNKNKTIQRYTDKAKPNHEKLKAGLDVLEKAGEKLNEKQLEQLGKDVTDLSKDIAEIVARGGEVPKDMMDSLERAQKILDNNGVFSDVKRIEDGDIMDTDDFPSGKYHTTSKFGVYEESEGIKEYKKAHNGEIPEDALFEVVKVITHPKVKKNEYGGVNSYGPGIAVVRLILPEEVGKLGNKKPVSQKADEPVKPQSKNTVTGTKTAVVDKTETSQKTAENIVKEAKAVEENKQLPATKTAVTGTKKTKGGTTIVDNFKKETKKYIPNAEEIEDEVGAWIDATLEEADIDGFVKGIAIIGSRSRGMDQDESDLDIVAEIEGNDLREDGLFNILNNEDYSLVYYKTDDGKYTLTRPKDYEGEGIKVDINPIIKDKTGTIEDYLIRETDYLGKKSTAYFEARGYYPGTEGWSIEKDRKKNGVKGPVWDWLKANGFADIDIEGIDLDDIDIKKLSGILNRGKDFDIQYDKSFDLRIIDKDGKEREYLKGGENKLLWNIKNNIRTNKRYPNTDYGKQAVTGVKTETPKAENVVTATKTAVTTPKATTKTKKGKSAKEQLEAIVKKRKDVEMYNFDDEDSEGGGRNSQRYLNFAKELKKAYKAIADENDMELVKFSVGYYNPTASFKKGDKYVYVSISDTRDPEWRKDVLYRDQASEKDTKGGRNQYTSLDKLADALKPNGQPDSTNIKNIMNAVQKGLEKEKEVKTEGTQGIKPQIEQGEIKGEMYHVTPEDFEKFKEGDTYNDSDWNTAFGTFVTDSKPFLEEFKETAMQRRRVNSPRKTKTLNVDLKNAVLHPYDVGCDFGADVEDSLIIDYLQLVGRWDIDTIKDVISFKLNDYAYSTQNTDNAFERDYDTYDWKDSYTKEEVLALPGSISGGIAEAQFEGDEVMLFSEYAEQDAKVLKDKGYDGVVFYEGQIDGKPVYSYALFYPNRYLENKETANEEAVTQKSKTSDFDTEVKTFTRLISKGLERKDGISAYVGDINGWKTRVYKFEAGDYQVFMGRGQEKDEKSGISTYKEAYLYKRPVKTDEVRDIVNAVITGFGDKTKLSWWQGKPAKQDDKGVYIATGVIDGVLQKQYIHYFMGDEGKPETASPTSGQHVNAFGLKKQKGGNRINNFSNVIMKIIDKYEDKIEDMGTVKTLEIKAGDIPLIIDYSEGTKRLYVSHPRNYGGDIIDDPGMRFTITENGGLHVTGVRLAFMMAQGYTNYAPIKDTDELLHTRAVNLEDQFLGESTIDEDTGEVRESDKEPKTASEVTNTKNAVTQVKAPESKTKVTNNKNTINANPATDEEITGRFRNLTAEDYKKMKQFEGKEELYYNSGEDPDALAYAFALEDVVEKLRYDNIHYDEYDNFEFDLNDPKALVDRKMFIKEYKFLKDVENGKITNIKDMLDHDYYIDNWEEYDEKHPDKFKPDWNIEMIIEGAQEFLQGAFGKGTVYDPFVTSAYNEFERLIKDKDKYLKDIDEKRETIKKLVDKYGKWREANGQTIDNAQKNNITANNKNVLTSNNNINGGSKTNSGEEYEGQNKLSNTIKTILTNDGGTKVTTNTGDISSTTRALNDNTHDSSKSGNGSRAGGMSKNIRSKGNEVITTKTVTQARDINRKCVSILEKHNYSTNPKDYTEDEINTLRQYEGRGGVNDKADKESQGALNQYYTKDSIIKAMWRLVDPYLPKDGNVDILEPSLGVGRFFMYAPENANLFGFEYDKVPGTIAQILYPDADIKIMDFQDNFMFGDFSIGENYRGRKYYVVIGNPPYEERQGRQKGLGEEPKINRFDDYFIKRGIDMLKDNGILIFVTSSQFLRGADNYAKQKISEKAQLIDAYRLPIGVFDRTGVETDIIMFQKSGAGDSKLLSASNWFLNHPEKILGEEKDVEGRFGIKKAVVGDADVIDTIAMDNKGEIKQTFTPTEDIKKEEPVTTKTIEAKKERKKVEKQIKKEWDEWSETSVDDEGNKIKKVLGSSWNGVVYKGKGGATGTRTVGKGGIAKYQKVLNANGKIGDPDITLDSDREGLNYINGELEPNLLYASGHIPTKLEQLERDYEGGFIDEQQYNKQKDLLENALPKEKPFQELYFSPYIDWILDFETKETRTVGWGNSKHEEKATIRYLFAKYIREKNYPKVSYKATKDGKRQVVTADAGGIMYDIIANKGAETSVDAKNAVVSMLPEEYNKFMKGSTIDDETKIKIQNKYNKMYNGYANFDYSDLGFVIEDMAKDFRGGEFSYTDVQARGISRILTTEAMIIAHGVGQGKTIEGVTGAIASMQQGKARKALIVIPSGTKSGRMQTVAELFPNQEMVDLQTLAKGTGVRKRLVEMFGPDPRDWIQDGQIVFLEHSGLANQISFKEETQSILESQLTDVMESNFDEQKNIDEAKEKLKKLEEQESNQKANESNEAKEKRKKKMDELIATISRKGRITDDPLENILSTYGKYLQGKNKEYPIIEKAVSLIKEDYDKFLSDFTEAIDKEIEGGAEIDKENAIEVANKVFANERPIYIEDLGIDYLMVDEAHNFRNLFNKSLEDPEKDNGWHAGTTIKEGSSMAKKLYGISQYIMSQNGGGNVILFTATPFINQPSEMYNMLSYVGKNGLMEMGVENIDAFYDNFVGMVKRFTPNSSASGGEFKNIVAGFNNIEVLVKNLLDRYVDYEGESGTVVKPRLVTRALRLKMSEKQAKVQKLLENQIDSNDFIDEIDGRILPQASKRKYDDRGNAQGAVIEGMTQANLNLISPYLTKYYKEELAKATPQEIVESSPKLEGAVKIIGRVRDDGITRGIFLFMEDGKELHEKLKKAIEDTYPGIRVGIINGDSKYSNLSAKEAEKYGINPEGAKARLTAKKFHDGELDVLIGGKSTKEGIELQGNGYITIEISQPRNMNDRTQLKGRVWRQGNLSNEVLDILLLMENSSDIYRFELMGRKEERWNILEELSAYKRGEPVGNVTVDTDQLDTNEEKLALYTDPEKKAKVSIVIDQIELEDKVNQLNSLERDLKKLIDIISNWGNDYGRYRKIGEGVGNMSKLYDDNNKAVTTNILDENALEPLEQQMDYAWGIAMEDAKATSDRNNYGWTKADMEKKIKNNDFYSTAGGVWRELRDKMSYAKSERNKVLRETKLLGLSTLNEISDYLERIVKEKAEIEASKEQLENELEKRTQLYKQQYEDNKANEMDIESILDDLEEDFRHQVTLPNKKALQDWLENTKDLPKREQARNKTAITGGKNKYTWKSKDYVGKTATYTKPKNLITSNFKPYTEEYKKPEIKYVGYVPKEVVKTKDGKQITKIGYQSQFRSIYDEIRRRKTIVANEENKKKDYYSRDVSRALKNDVYYQQITTRLKNMILKFAERFDDEIIKAFKKDNPGITNPTVEDFYNYLNDYNVAGDEVVKIDNEYVKQGAEYLLEEFNNSGNSKNSLISNGKNKLTS